jgi:hypothetical protein
MNENGNSRVTWASLARTAAIVLTALALAGSFWALRETACAEMRAADTILREAQAQKNVRLALVEDRLMAIKSDTAEIKALVRENK